MRACVLASVCSDGTVVAQSCAYVYLVERSDKGRYPWDESGIPDEIAAEIKRVGF